MEGKYILQIVEQALKDPLLKIDYIGENNYLKLAKSLLQIPEDAILSEWLYHIGQGSYEYHIHTNGIRDQLQTLYNQKVRVGNPRLIKLYSRKELEEIVAMGKKFKGVQKVVNF